LILHLTPKELPIDPTTISSWIILSNHQFSLTLCMAETIEIPAELAHFQLPDAVQKRLQFLLDRQDSGELLTQAERQEAEGLVELAEFLSLLRLRSQHIAQQQ
jgi:hypothetical protein